MKTKEVANWLGVYFMLTLVILGGVLILGRAILPMERSDSTAVFQIIIPTFLAQLTLLSRWFTREEDEEKEIHLPVWLVKGPPLLVVVSLLLGVTLMVVGNASAKSWTPSSEDFRYLVTFCVSILNATTLVVTGKYFESASKQVKPQGNNIPITPVVEGTK